MTSPPERRAGLRASQMSGANRAAILDLLRRFPQLSRAELARRSGLSEGTVSRIVARLIAEHLVMEQGAANSTGGRPGTRLQLNQDHLRSIGVEIGRWETRISAGTLNGQILDTRCFRTPEPPLKAVERIAAECQALERRYGAERIEGVGVCLRGIVNHHTGVLELGSSREWDQVPVKEILEKSVSAPVFVENNVRAAALAEYSFGGSVVQNSHCLVLVKVDEGLGAGIVLNGELYGGPHMAAGEFGQMVIADSPGSGAQDRTGCLESLAANPALAARYGELLGERKPKTGECESRVRRICHLAMAGDAAARQAINGSARYLGIGIANIVWGLDADVVVLDGVITEAWPLVAPAILEQFPPGNEFPNFRDLVLRPTSLGAQAALVGAASLPFARLFATGRSARRTGGG